MNTGTVHQRDVLNEKRYPNNNNNNNNLFESSCEIHLAVNVIHRRFL